MKTIVVFTECNKSSYPVTQQAYKLAAEFKTDLLLFNPIHISVNYEPYNLAAWNANDFNIHREISYDKLTRLKCQLEKNTFNCNFRYKPIIRLANSFQNANKALMDIERANEILMIAMEHKRNKNSFLDKVYGQQNRQVITKANSPLFIIPYHYHCGEVKQVGLKVNKAEAPVPNFILSIVPHLPSDFVLLHISPLNSNSDPVLKRINQNPVDGIYNLHILKKVTNPYSIWGLDLKNETHLLFLIKEWHHHYEHLLGLDRINESNLNDFKIFEIL